MADHIAVYTATSGSACVGIASPMASFGEDVSMDDFRPLQIGESTDTGAGHTSDGSVLNVQIPSTTPRSGDPTSVAGAGVSVGAGRGATGVDGGAFGSLADPATRGQVIRACRVHTDSSNDGEPSAAIWAL